MKKQNYEDLIMKRAMDLFAEEGLKYFGIEKKVKEVGPTELVVLETKNLHMDYTFLMEDDSYIHFEFQTTDKGSLDLRRFRAYEALLSHQTNKDVETYVIYSNGIKAPMTGFNNYMVKTVTLADKNVNEIFDAIKDKLDKGTEVTKQEVIALAFTPIMGGSMSKQEKIIKAIRITMTINKEYRYDVQSILYAFANKFLEGKELEDVKEELKMTELGKSLIKEGREEGIEEGKKKKAIETAQEAINMGLEDEKIIKLTGLTIEELKLLKEMA